MDDYPAIYIYSPPTHQADMACIIATVYGGNKNGFAHPDTLNATYT